MFDYLARDRRRLRRGTRAFAREVLVGEACVFVDHGFQWDGSNNVWLTRARASYVMQAGPSFDLRPRNLWNRLFGLGSRHAAIDPYFDAFFAVRTPAPSGTWEALTARARTLLVGSFEDARLVSDGTMVTLWREGDFGREADAEAAAELVSEIVSWHTGALESLRRLPGARYVPASGRWDQREPPRAQVLASVPVEVGPAALGGQPVMSVRVACGRATPPFSVDLDGELSSLGSSPGGDEPRPAPVSAPNASEPQDSGRSRSARGSSDLSTQTGHTSSGSPSRPSVDTASRPSVDTATAAPARPSVVPPTARPSVDEAAATAQRLSALGATRLECDGRWVTLYWRRLDIERDRLLSGARLVSAFAAARAGAPYR